MVTAEIVQRLYACKCLADVSALREELYDELEPEHHCLFFSRTAHFVGQDDDPAMQQASHNTGTLILLYLYIYIY